MSGAPSVVARRNWWTALVGLGALATWIVAIGVGARAWILEREPVGIVAHVDAVGASAGPWMTLAAILTLTTVVMGLGVSLVRHLVDGPVASTPSLPEVEEVPALPRADEQDPVQRAEAELSDDE